MIRQIIKQNSIKWKLLKYNATNKFNLERADNYKQTIDSKISEMTGTYLTAHDNYGNTIVLRLTVQGYRAEVWVVYKDCDGNSFTNLNSKCLKEESPLIFEPIKIGYKWNIKYDGDLVDVKTGKLIPVKFELVYSGRKKIFNNYTEFSPAIVSKYLTKQFLKEFQLDKSNNRLGFNFDQSGTLNGQIKFNNQTKDIDLVSLRNKFSGNRDWSLLIKHYRIIGIFEDNMKLNISFFCTTSTKEIKNGYIEENGKYTTVDDIELLSEISFSKVEKVIKFKLTLSDERSYSLVCQKEEDFSYRCGDVDYRVLEGIGKLNLGGKIGRGILEFGANSEYRE